MSPSLTKEQMDKAIEFHGHWCPGLAMGIRAAQWVLENIGSAQDEEIVVITETDMCAVDAIQALVGCTFGKGNLIYRDYGKVAFSFYRRKDGKKARLVLRSDSVAVRSNPEFQALKTKKGKEGLSPEELKRFNALKEERINAILSSPFEELYDVKEPSEAMPQRARIMSSIPCEKCKEAVMESRIRRLGGKYYCIECFKALDARN